jgi:hypothetical protein
MSDHWEAMPDPPLQPAAAALEHTRFGLWRDAPGCDDEVEVEHLASHAARLSMRTGHELERLVRREALGHVAGPDRAIFDGEL